MVPKNLRVLVTGGAGFIGSHIVDKLIEAEVEVTVLDNLETGQMENIAQHKQNDKFHFIKGDIRNFRLVKNSVKDMDAVFNIAAIVSVTRSIENPLLANEVNLKGTLNLLKASLDSDVKRFIQASSASVYGDTQTLPVCEDFAPKPLSPYAVSKLAADNYAAVFHQVYGLETVCLRYFNVYGPRQTNNPYSGAITIFANDLLGNRPPKIFGDGKQTRDFVFFEDVASANLLALTKKKAAGEVFNISTGKATSINRLLQMMQEITGKTKLKPIYKDVRPGDIRDSYACIDKAKKVLGYEPTTPLEVGLKKIMDWYSNKFTQQQKEANPQNKYE